MSEGDDVAHMQRDEMIQKPPGSITNWISPFSDEVEMLSEFEKQEAEQDLSGKNLLAAAAPRSLLNLGIEAFNRELCKWKQQVIPEHKQQLPPSSSSVAAVAASPLFHSQYIRTMFIRAARMDVSKAVQRLVAYLSVAAELFGSNALHRPIQASDLSLEDQENLRKGWMQLLLTRDAVGRRIIVFDDLGPGHFYLQNKLRVALFMLQAASTDEDSQNQGVQVVLQIFDTTNSTLMNDSSTREQFCRLFACSPVRMSTIHICASTIATANADLTEGNEATEQIAVHSSPGLDTIRENVRALFGRDERVRTKFHSGSIIHCHGKLAEYGINPDLIPMTSTGGVKLREHEKWILIQVERDRAQQLGQSFPIVECPIDKHILLVKGRYNNRHEGNVRLRSVLQERYDERNNATRARKITITSEVMELLHEEGYTFLVKNSSDFWVVPDRKTVLEKLAIAFRTVPRLKPIKRTGKSDQKG